MLLSQLTQLLDKTELDLSDQQAQQLVDYLGLLDKWNKAYNLTSVRDPQQMLTKHIVDSVVVSPYLVGSQFIDVGTGPGLPGIPLAIANPDKHFVLLDSLGKRVRFLNQVKIELGLTNITPVQSRVEEFEPTDKLDGVLSRAFASISDMVEWCGHLIDHEGKFFALKGQISEEEMQQLPSSVQVEEIIKLDVPSLEGERHLVKLIKSND